MVTLLAMYLEVAGMGSGELAGHSAGIMQFMTLFVSHAALRNSGLKVTSENLEFDGTQVAKPCELNPDTKDIRPHLGT